MIRNKPYTINLHVTKVLLLIVTIMSILLDIYDILLLSFSSYLLINGLQTKKVNNKFFSFYFLLYLFIPFLNISNYRGYISIKTLEIYCITMFTTLVLINFSEKPTKRKQTTNIQEYVSSNKTKWLFNIHIGIIYLCILYVYTTIGIIFLRQDLRFNIPPIIEYIIKSGLSLPVIWIYTSNLKINWKELVHKFVLPTLPSLLIGSRGTFIMVLISLFVSLYLFKLIGPKTFKNKFNTIHKNFSKITLIGSLVGLIALYSGFYIRRDGRELLTAGQVLSEYSFTSKGALVMAILPVYLNFRETIGITNKIITENIKNTYSDYPLFFSELITILPGHQEAPGIIIARDVYMATGTDEKYSLTPGIIGGLYMDFGYFFIILVEVFVILLIILYNRGLNSLKYRLLYSFSIVQFFHLYHRGFMKIEYIFPYIIIIVYMLTLKKITPSSKKLMSVTLNRTKPLLVLNE